MGLFEDKEAVLAEHKTAFIDGHPVWGVKGIPDPDWSDIKWWRRVQSMVPSDVEKAYHAAGYKGKIWRVAKALELRLQQDDSLKFNVHRTFKKSSVAEIALKTMRDSERITQLRLVFNQGGGRIAGAGSYYINRTLNNTDMDLIELLAEYGVYDKDQMTSAAIKIARDDNFALFEKIVSADAADLNTLLMRTADLNADERYLDVLVGNGACPSDAMARAMTYLDDRPELQDVWGRLIDKGGSPQKILAENYEDMLPEQILFLEEKGADLYFDGGKLFVYAQSADRDLFHALCNSKYKKEKDVPPENRIKLPVADTYIRQTISGEYQGGVVETGESWEKLSETDIVKTIMRADGVRLNTYFNFNACRIRETQETPEGVYPLFSYNFRDVENDREVQDAAQALTERGGMPWPKNTKTRNVRPLKGGPLKSISEKPA